MICGCPGVVEEGWCCHLSFLITPSRNGRELMGNQFSLWKAEISDFSLDLISSILSGQLSLRI